jgi:hypothetical protein
LLHGGRDEPDRVFGDALQGQFVRIFRLAGLGRRSLGMGRLGISEANIV